MQMKREALERLRTRLKGQLVLVSRLFEAERLRLEKVEAVLKRIANGGLTDGRGHLLRMKSVSRTTLRDGD